MKNIDIKHFGDGVLEDTINAELKQYIDRIEQLENEKFEVTKAVRDVYATAKGDGFEPKVMRQIIKLRKLKRHEAEEQEMLLESYKRALGMG